MTDRWIVRKEEHYCLAEHCDAETEDDAPDDAPCQDTLQRVSIVRQHVREDGAEERNPDDQDALTDRHDRDGPRVDVRVAGGRRRERLRNEKEEYRRERGDRDAEHADTGRRRVSIDHLSFEKKTGDKRVSVGERSDGRSETRVASPPRLRTRWCQPSRGR